MGRRKAYRKVWRQEGARAKRYEQPRKNGKSWLMETRGIYGVLACSEKNLYTAHDYSTITQLFDRMRDYFSEKVNDPNAEYPELNSLVRMVRYAADYERPFGTGRITREVRGYIDSAVRENINEEVASAFAASAQKNLLGTDHDPFGERSRWDAYIGTIFNIDVGEGGTVPQFGQLPQPSMQPLTDHFRNLCSKMAAATGIHASQFGVTHDNPASSDAIYAENEPLVLACTVWNTDAGITLQRVAIAAIATEMGTTYDDVLEADLGIDTHFMNPAMPTLAQMADSSIKLASAVEGFADTDTFWEMNGFDSAQRKRIHRELRQVRGMDLLRIAMKSNTTEDAEADDAGAIDRKIRPGA